MFPLVLSSTQPWHSAITTTHLSGLSVPMRRSQTSCNCSRFTLFSIPCATMSDLRGCCTASGSIRHGCLFYEVLRAVVSLGDGWDLELKLHQLGIKQAKEHVVGALAIDFRELKIFVVKALLNARLRRLFAHLVVFIGGALNVIERRILRP